MKMSVTTTSKKLARGKELDDNNARALTRYLKFSFAEGYYTGVNDPNLNQAIEPKIPSQLAFKNEIADYSKIIDNEVTERDLANLIKFFHAEVSTNIWARMLFYIISDEGKTKNSSQELKYKDSIIYMSALPKLFYPTECLVRLDGCSGLIDLNGPKHKRYRCKQCSIAARKKEWEDYYRPVIKEAFQCVYNEPPYHGVNLSSDNSHGTIEDNFNKIWKGYLRLLRYDINAPYIPVATKQLEPFKDWRASKLLRYIALLPHELLEYEGGESSLCHKTVTGLGGEEVDYVGHPSQHVTFGNYNKNSTGHSPTLLPIAAFKEKGLRRKNPSTDDSINKMLNFPLRTPYLYEYKVLTCLKNKNDDPLPWDLKTNSQKNDFAGDIDNFVLLEHLDDYRIDRT